ncbi:hypothetical protein [Flavobacterium foetidum]|uniref:hypothetical protein n=1 Tax=Flavobacterium foetidum TaxID=2026681 RepID=UPI001FC97969|nr:hypothetical protein [Flavobacterium foetidum]
MKNINLAIILTLSLFLSFNNSYSRKINEGFNKLLKLKTKDAFRPNLRKSTSKSLAIDPPKLTARGNQLYCPQTSIKIVTDIKISHDAAENGTQAVYIQISSGYSADLND